MDKYGDPGWHYHATIAKVWGVLAAQVVDSPIIQFSAENYAKAFASYVNRTETKLANSKLADKGVSLHKLAIAVEHLYNASSTLDAKAKDLAVELEHAKDLPWWKWWKKAELFRAAKQINNKYKLLERQFLYAEGLDNRNWFKHTVFAPGRWTGYAGAVFPGLVESIEDADVGNLYRWEDIISRQVYAACRLMNE